MGRLHTISAPSPALYATGDRPPVSNAYFAVTVDAAVDLVEAREYQNRSPAQRVSKALAEQQAFLDRFSDPELGVALDLRIATDPTASTPVSVALLGRVWGSSVGGVTERADDLRAQVHGALPRHVTGTVVEDADTVVRLLSPFAGTPVDSAVITRHELLGLPSRPDAGVSYYYSALPFNWSDNDWSTVYAALAASPVPVVLSVAVLPIPVPAQFAQTLLTLATFYGWLAREGEMPGGLYSRGQRFAPEPFAVDAEKAFHDYSGRLSQQAFALRIQVSAAKHLPPGIVETIADAISPAAPADRFLEHQRPVSAYDVRRPASVAERRLAEYNLNVINFGMLTGRPEIWSRPDPPDPQLAMLSVLGDARDAACAFRFPIAADGIVPGIRVRRGHLRQVAAKAPDGPVIRIGKVTGTDQDTAVSLRSLTRHALIAGSAGSGKTSTAVELLRQLWVEHQIPFLVIDPVNSNRYRELAAEPGFESLEVITIGDESAAPLRFNPFEVPAGVLVGEHLARLLACFTAAFGLFGPLPSIYQDAFNLTYLRAGFLSTERPTGVERTWPTIVEFLGAMSEVTEGLGYPGDVRASIDAASSRRIRQLVRGSTASAFLTDQRGDIARLLGHPVILELKSLGPGNEQALMMALLLNAITEHNQSVRAASPDLVHVTLVEDAHRLLARAAGGKSSAEAQAKQEAAATFAYALAENREYGEGVLIAEQWPAKLVADAVTNANLKIMHRLTAEDDRRYLAEAMAMDEAQRLLAAHLPTGEALLSGDEFAEATHITITRTSGAGTPSPDVVQPPGAVQSSATAPFAACDRCRAQCAYRGASLSMVNDPGIVEGITDAADAIARADTAPAERRAGLIELRGRLLDTVGRFAALPSADPARSDAAFCLFLHVYMSSALRVTPEWPAAAARLLGIGDAVAATGEAESIGDSILHSAADITGQAETSARSGPDR